MLNQRNLNFRNYTIIILLQYILIPFTNNLATNFSVTKLNKFQSIL